jgi:Holliday junction resolvase RusA-like endonuclease
MRYIRIDGIPKGQPRPRAFAVGGKAHVYNPGTAENWKSQIALAFRDFARKPITGPVSLAVSFYMPRPKRLMRKKDPDGMMLHTAKPDIDNLLKAVMDALTTIGVWHDDTQVVSVSASKNYCEKDGKPGAMIGIKEIEQRRWRD